MVAQTLRMTKEPDITEDNIERARDMVLLDRQVTIDEVTHCLQITHGSAYEVTHNKLGVS